MTFELDPTVTAGELLTVVVAVLAGAVVAIQSVHTARSAKASKDAAVAASEGLKVATKALDVASKEERHSRTLVIEAHRARIDAALPAVSVSPGDVQWPLYVCTQPEHGGWKELVPTDELALPGHGSTALALRSSVSLQNGSARVVELWLTYTAYENQFGEPPRPRPVERRRVLLPPGGTEHFQFLVWTTVADWVENGAPDTNYNAWLKRAAPFVSCVDTADSGATRGWRVVVDGPPLHPVEGKTGAYVRASIEPTVRVPPENREYWLSQSRRIPLDPPAID